MKKITVLMITVFLNIAFYSCTPQALSDETQIENSQRTGGHDGQTTGSSDDPSK